MKRADVRLFTFVMGNSANTPLLEDLAKASRGFSLSLSNDDAIVGQILLARSKLGHEAMHDVRLGLKGGKVSQLTPSAPRTLFRGDQLVVFGKFREAGPGTLELSARVSGRPLTLSVPVTFPESDARSPELERLWALARIEELESEKRLGGDAAEAEAVVRDLGTRYSLVTDHTAMVVMKDQGFADRGVERRNLARVGRERAAQQGRAAAPPAQYARAYSPSPLPGSSAPRLGGGGGGGAVGPLFGLLSGGLAFGLPALRRRRR
jgi:Ca-activated chloride channel family protein